MPPDSGAAAYTEVGNTGLKHQQGRIQEEWMPQLRGPKGMKVIREMIDTDPIVGGVLYAIEEVLRGVEWMVVPAEADEDGAVAQFVSECMEDMSHTWGDFISDALSKLPFGWAYFEVIYKQRLGTGGGTRSKYDDGRIGWRKFGLRSQDSLDRWQIDSDGGIRGLWQSKATTGNSAYFAGSVFLPIERCLLFRTSTRKGNPEGRSILRNAYTSWWEKKRVQHFELMGIERDLAGIPSFGLPPEMFDANAPPAVKQALLDFKEAASQLRADEQSCLVWPLVRDENGNQMIEIGLLKSPGTRQHDTSGVIERLARWMAISTLQDVIMLGHEHVGSLALADVKRQLGLAALKAQIDEIADVINRHEVSRLLRLNGIDPELAPEITPGEISQRDIEQFADVIKKTSDAGMPWFPNEQVQNEILTLLGFDPIEITLDDGTGFEPSIVDPEQPMNGSLPTRDSDLEDESDPAIR